VAAGVGVLVATCVGVVVVTTGAEVAGTAAAGGLVLVVGLEPLHADKPTAATAASIRLATLAVPRKWWDCMIPPLRLMLVPGYWRQLMSRDNVTRVHKLQQ
jgi:hypothetical protein